MSLCALVQLFLCNKVLNLDLLGTEDMPISSADIIDTIMSFHLGQSDGGKRKHCPF